MLANRQLVAFYTIIFLAVLVSFNFYGHNDEDARRLEIEQRQLYVADGRKHIARNFKLSYVHIPKTGGSTIEDSSLFDHKRRLGLSPRSHFSVRALKNASQTEGFVVATHIRDPCERFVSAFLYVRYDERSMGMRNYAQEFGIFDSGTAEEFVDWLDETKKWDALKRGVLSHFRPMVLWMIEEDAASFGVDLVMCQEDWEEGIKRLLDKLQADPISTKLFAHKRVNWEHKKTCNDLEPRYSAKILEQYALDACLFGYGRFGQGVYAIEGRNATKCIGAQFDRNWFTERLSFCKVSLGMTLTSVDLYG
jgi:Sulfotransferase family